MSELSFPRPPEILPPPNLPIYAYPGFPPLLTRPDLPSLQRKPIWEGDNRIPYSLSTHIVPAAYHREDDDVILPATPPSTGSMSKEEREKIVQTSEIRLREIRRNGGKPQEKVLWLSLNRYFRTTTKKGGYTLFLAHANGFHKEAWEPTILSLLSSSESQSLVQEIWVWEVVNHGDSALLNKGKLNTLLHSRSSARDLLCFLLYSLPSSCDSSPLPVHLHRLSQSEVRQRIKSGFMGPDSSRLPICGVGHSFGGAVSTLAALSHPALFTSLFLVDPVITYPRTQYYYTPGGGALRALGRRAVWKSRQDALKGFVASPFFRAWDPRVLDLYVEAGLYEDQDVARLKTSPIQEAILFNDAELGAAEVWTRLWRKELDPRITLKWVMPGPGMQELDSRPNASQQRVWLRPENSSNVRIESSGHLIPQEKPGELGKEIGKYLKEMGTSIRSRL
ncbi:Alpha/beta hydrolase family-domain-containing protein [Rhodocollybia butyracea]|uniref:Alpha/beta hydrolase family-domain-containing protein n=1 Tax=Rhodocollybia butyracea TaxID=206335 RepID=A0A9P5QCS3_9AGAR|nr:Alpha/beta hydrolase family-domain-containing protein [Rhodocollybia butyracea]